MWRGRGGSRDQGYHHIPIRHVSPKRSHERTESAKLCRKRRSKRAMGEKSNMLRQEVVELDEAREDRELKLGFHNQTMEPNLDKGDWAKRVAGL